MEYVLLVIIVLLLVINIILIISYKKLEKINEVYKAKDAKKEAILQFESAWIKFLHRNDSVLNYFHKRGIKTVAIYGIGVLGKNLFDEISDSEITVGYIIDSKQKSKEYKGVPIYDMNTALSGDVDVIVVTPIQEFAVIKERLEQVYNGKIISLEEILYYTLWDI